MRLILFLFLSLSLHENAISMGSKRPRVPLPTKPPPETMVSKVTFEPDKNYSTEKEREIILKAADKLEEVIRSQCFVDFMRSAKLLETNGRTNEEVLNHLLGMKDVVPVKVYSKKWGDCLTCTSAVAYRSPPSKTINLNRSFFTAARPICRWAATMAHEALGHALGNYGHSSDWNVNREYTVPYKLSGAKKQYGSNVFDECCQ